MSDSQPHTSHADLGVAKDRISTIIDRTGAARTGAKGDGSAESSPNHSDDQV
jgi:hypothetical protein